MINYDEQVQTIVFCPLVGMDHWESLLTDVTFSTTLSLEINLYTVEINLEYLD